MANVGDNVTVSNYYANSSGIQYDGYDDFPSNTLTANNSITFTDMLRLRAYPSPNYRNVTFGAPHIYLNANDISIYNNGYNSITFDNSSVNFDNAIYNPNNKTDGIGPIGFTGTSSINVTSNTNGKTIIKASTLTGTVSLDVESDVQEGDTFLIEATDNQLVITDGEWTATPSTVGNVTTYTLAKAGPSKKFRLFYTVDGGNRTLRLLGGIV